jgi:TatD DNase family protein
MSFIDSHVHIPLLSQASTQVLTQCAEKNISILLNVGYDFLSSCQSLKLSMEHDSVYASAGLHPHYVSEEQWGDLKNWYSQEQIFSHSRCVAWGEIGLDYVRSQTPHKIQQVYFDYQLQWAYEKKLPVLIHNREADQDVLQLLSHYPGIKGVMHCYSSSDDKFAEQVLAMGFMISFAGNLTYPASSFLRNLAQKLPIESLLLETDAPYLSPIPHRGRENHPTNVLEMYHLVAKLRAMEMGALTKNLQDNFHRMFGSKGVEHEVTK